MAIRLVVLVVTMATLGCSAGHRSIRIHAGRAFVQAEALFHQNERWLGADAALTIPLDSGRTLWLFGDTFIARSDAHVRTESTMVRNTVAIQTGDDPLTATMAFHWQRTSDGLPAPFFADRGEVGYWPGHGIRLDEGPLVVFLYAIVSTPGEGLGFATRGCVVVVIDNPDASPQDWMPRLIEIAPSVFDAIPATAVVREGDHIVALAIRQEGAHAGALVRYRVDQIVRGIADPQWWAGYQRGWVQEADLGTPGPAFVLDDAGAECSIHRDQATGSFVHVASYGFGASTIGLRTAPALTGPWSAPATVYRPPESDGPRPLVYAAKAHRQLAGPESGDLVITYATNSFEFGDLFTSDGARLLYWPRFVLVGLGE